MPGAWHEPSRHDVEIQIYTLESSSRLPWICLASFKHGSSTSEGQACPAAPLGAGFALPAAALNCISQPPGRYDQLCMLGWTALRLPWGGLRLKSRLLSCLPSLCLVLQAGISSRDLLAKHKSSRGSTLASGPTAEGGAAGTTGAAAAAACCAQLPPGFKSNLPVVIVSLEASFVSGPTGTAHPAWLAGPQVGWSDC